MTPRLVATAYATVVDARTVRVERRRLGWVARRGQMYVRTEPGEGPQWLYKVATEYATAELAAVAANNAPREGEGIREGWWYSDRW